MSSSWSTIGALLTTALISMILIACVWKTGPVPQIIFGHDLIFFLDGAWKLTWGFVPHTDYYSSSGPLTFLLPALGMRLSGTMAGAMPAAICIFAAAALPVCAYVAFSRLNPWAASAVLLVLIASALTPHELRFSAQDWSYSAHYNRWGYVLFCIVALVVTIVPRKRTRGTEMLDGAIAGASVVASIFLKISFGLLGLAALCFFFFIRRRTGFFAFGVAMAGSTITIAFGILLRWGFPQFLADMRLVAQARKSLGATALLGWIGSIGGYVLLFALLGVMWVIVSARYRGQQLLHRAAEAALLFGCYMVWAGAILMTNSPLGTLGESPVLCVGALVFLSGIMEQRRFEAGTVASWDWERFAVVGCAAFVASLIVIPMAGRDLVSIGQAWHWKSTGQHLAPKQVFQSGGLRDIEIKFFGGDPPLPTSYVGKVQDGLELLRQTGNSARPAVALDFANPFNVARKIKPSRTSPTVWQLNIIYSREHAPAAERVFGPDDVVMIAKQFGDGYQENLAVMRELYGSFLDAHYETAGESAQWKILVPRVPGNN